MVALDRVSLGHRAGPRARAGRRERGRQVHAGEDPHRGGGADLRRGAHRRARPGQGAGALRLHRLRAAGAEPVPAHDGGGEPVHALQQVGHGRRRHRRRRPRPGGAALHRPLQDRRPPSPAGQGRGRLRPAAAPDRARLHPPQAQGPHPRRAHQRPHRPRGAAPLRHRPGAARHRPRGGLHLPQAGGAVRAGRRRDRAAQRREGGRGGAGRGERARAHPDDVGQGAEARRGVPPGPRPRAGGAGGGGALRRALPRRVLHAARGRDPGLRRAGGGRPLRGDADALRVSRGRGRARRAWAGRPGGWATPATRCATACSTSRSPARSTASCPC